MAAMVVLRDSRRDGSATYLATTSTGREFWCEDPERACVYPSLAEAQRVALAMRRRPGRPQPFAAPRSVAGPAHSVEIPNG